MNYLRYLVRVAALSSATGLSIGSAYAGPLGGTVTAGSAQISTEGATTTVQQSSQNTIINWQTFDIGANEAVRFFQPDSTSVALNRVLGGDASQIMGNLSANGKIFLINPNGVLFGNSAQVDVGGLVVSTRDIADNDFLNGRFIFNGTSDASIVNRGSISAPGGYIALLGAHVSNEGVIAAKLGSVVLASGNTLTLDVAGDGLLNVAVNSGAVNALASNGGLIRADGGQVLLTARSASGLLQSAVNNTGVIQAQTIENRGGVIKLLGDMRSGVVNVGGLLDASAPNGGDGGFIDTSAAHVAIDSDARVATLAVTGQTGEWLIDPADFRIAASGGDITGAQLSSNLAGSNITILSSSGASGVNGDIHVNDTVTWSANQLTLNADRNININTAMFGSGSASLALLYGQGAVAAGNSAVVNITAPVNLPAGNNFSTQLGSNGSVINYTVITSLGAAGSTTGTDLQGINGNLAGNYALGSDINASATSGWNAGAGFVPIGTDPSRFTGNFDGLGHTVSTVYINRTGINNTGLFGYTATGSMVRNVGMLGGSVTSDSWATGSLVGQLGGSLLNSYATTNVTGFQTAGGLVGVIDGGLIDGSHAGGTVYSAGNGEVGGLVGLSWGPGGGTTRNSYATGNASSTVGNVGGLMGINWGTITNSYATGTATGVDYVGGLVGNNSIGSISNSYATGAVSGNQYVGGLAGNNSNSISTSFSSSAVTGSSNVGGLLGTNYGSVTNSYWNTTTSGQASSAAGTGLTTAAMQAALPTGFSSSTWSTASNRTTPFLLSNVGPVLITTDASTTYYTVVSTLNQLQNIYSNPVGNYVLINDIDATPTSGWNSGQGFMPIGNGAVQYTGIFDGMGHVVNGLYINRSGTNNQGLFGATNNATFRNVGVTNANVTGNTYVGPLVANCFVCSYDYVYSTGTSSGVAWVGGLVGLGNGSYMDHSYSTANVTGSSQLIGGLFGQARFFGTIDNSYASGNVAGGSATYVGGLTGQARYVTLTNTYATGNVTGGFGVGGLTGILDGATINTSFSTGAVNGSGGVGGLVGTLSQTTAVNNSYWNTTTSGRATSQGGTGLTTAAMQAALPTGFSSGSWGNGSNHTTPYLLSLPGRALIDTDATATYYTIIQTLQQLQNIGSNLSGRYALGNNIDASASAGWNSGQGFAPIGDASTPFTGSLDGLGFSVNNLTINRPTTNYVGLIGSASNAGVNRLGVANANIIGQDYVGGVFGATVVGNSTRLFATGQVTGRNSVGGLIGYNNTMVLSSSYSTANISGANRVGGLMGETNGGIATSLNYASGSVTATGNYAGGLVGYNGFAFVITNSYATGNVSGVNAVGGFVGYHHNGDITRSYSSGSVSGSSLLGGFIGQNNAGTVSSSYWNITTSGQASSSGGTGRTNAQMQTASTFSGFDFNAAWIIYQGNTAPLLRTFMTPLTVTANNLTKSYDGATYVGSAGVTYSSTPNMSNLFGTLSYTGGTNAGSYTITPSGLYSNQHGYAISFASGTLTINPAILTATAVAANKVYDGTTIADVTLNGITGLVGSETLGITNTASFNSKDVATANLVTVDSIVLANGTNGGLASNYTLASGQTASANITPVTLTATAAAADKVYDGTTTAVATLTGLSGLVGSETIGATANAAFNSKDVNTANLVTVGSTVLANGTNGGLASNYSLAGGQTASAHITAKALTGTASSGSKVYDGTTAASVTLGGVSGFVGNESVGVNATGTFNSKDVSTANLITVNSISLTDGANGGLASNYSFAGGQTIAASITPRTVTVTATASDKVYDGSRNASVTLTGLNGLIGNETLASTATGTFNSKNVATANLVTVDSIVLTNGANGGLASNYSLSAGQTAAAHITPRSITIVGDSALDKIYDGTRMATVSGGSLTGLIGSDAVSISRTAEFATANVGNDIPVATTYALSGSDSANYALVAPTGLAANINPLVASIALPSNVNPAAAIQNGIGQSSTETSTAPSIPERRVEAAAPSVVPAERGFVARRFDELNLTVVTDEQVDAQPAIDESDERNKRRR